MNHDSIHVHPFREALAHLLRQASESLNRPLLGFIDLDALWPTYEEMPEGEYLWDDYRSSLPTDDWVGELWVAWWSDYLGRRHVRIQAITHDRHDEPIHPGTWHPTPYLFAIYPDVGFLRIREEDGERDLLVLCPCGAAGTPLEIAWMGREYGPCHDRREAGELPVRPWNAGRTRISTNMAENLLHLEFLSADVLRAGARHAGFQWNLRTGEHGPPPAFEGDPLAWSAQADTVLLDQQGWLVLWNPQTEQAERRFPADDRAEAREARFSPSGRYLAVWEFDGFGSRLRVWDRHRPPAEPITYSGGTFSWAISRDECLLTISENEDRLYFYSLGTARPERRRSRRFRHWAGDSVDLVTIDQLHRLPDGDLLVITENPILLRVLEVPSGKVLRERRLGEQRLSREAMWVDPTNRVVVVPQAAERTLTLISLPDLEQVQVLTLPEGPTVGRMCGNDRWLVVGDGSFLRVLPGPPLIEWFLREIRS